jgi:Mrp family chromosome partitioning ATPase
MLAPGVDGVVLVVEADRTKRDQIQRAQRTIEMANGNLLGLVLNKRRYVVPRWLYRKL